MEMVTVVTIVNKIDNCAFLLGVYGTWDKAAQAVNIEKQTGLYPADLYEFRVSQQMVR